MKIGIIGASAHFLAGHDIVYINHPEDVKRCDLLILPGGSDIHPSLYGEQDVFCSSVGNKPSISDEFHWNSVKEAVRLGKGIFGICRGAQLLCAFTGGKLFQHVDNHAGLSHDIVTDTGKTLKTNSLHHQAMRLGDGAVLLAQTPYKIADHRYDASGEVASDEPEVEAAAWPDINAAGVQGHPEWMPFLGPLAVYSRQIIEDYINV